MRLLALAFFAAVALPAAAQSQFVAACAAEPELTALEGIDAPALCGCVAERMMALGVAGETLDQSIAYRTPEEVEAGPPEIREAATAARLSTVQCLLGQQTPALVGAAQPGGPAVSGKEGPGAPAAARPPAGMRTGNGTAPVRTHQAGTGAAIRIVG